MNFEKEIEELKVKIVKIEELIDGIIDKGTYKNLFKEQVRLLNSEYSNILNNIKKEFNKYDPKKQVNVKRLLFSKLPDKDMELGNYMITVKELVVKYNLDINLAEYEILLHKLGFIKNNMVNCHNISQEKMNNFLDVL